MFEANIERAMSMIGPTDKVLDIGGWARPFNRANWVLDAEPYETRGNYGPLRPAQGGKQEYFTKNSWIQRDICDRVAFPFADKEIDFVICSHTLEDIRDPLWVCSEMVRVAKRGYLEVPSRVAESSRGTEPGQVGWSHHRWLIDIDGNTVRFLMKYHMIHSHWRFSLPATHLRSLSEEQQVQWLFWESSFSFQESILHGVDNIAAELEGFVQRIRPYAGWRLEIDRQFRRAQCLTSRVSGKLKRTLRYA